jgi:hypothetical protein
VALAGALILLAIVAEVMLQVGLPAGGLSRDRAIDMASRQVHSTSPTQISFANAGPLLMFGTDVSSSPSRLVWAVNFSGTFPPSSCGPYIPNAKPHCPPPNHHELVVLDYFDGTFIYASLYP